MLSSHSLSGLRVLEFGGGLAASYCTKLMADLGAEVIKVEAPDGGDTVRRIGPFPGDVPHIEKSGTFLWLNTNKTGVTVDPGTPTGRKLLDKLLEQVSALVYGIPPVEAKRIGLDYESLSPKYPGLVVTAISSFGQDGPYRDLKTYPINVSAAGGTSVATGEPKRAPVTLPLSVGAYEAGAEAAGATLVACLNRDRTGVGAFVDISEVEVLANNHVGTHLLNYIYRGVSGIRKGNHGGYFYYPCACLPCKDGQMCLLAPQKEQWIRFVELMGTPEWSKNPRYRDRRAMSEEYTDEADALLIPWLKEHTKTQLFDMAMKAHIPFAPVETTDDIVRDPQLIKRGFYTRIRHETAGEFIYPGASYQIERDKPDRPAPRLGEHNELIFGERLGYSRQEIQRLREYGAI